MTFHPRLIVWKSRSLKSAPITRLIPLVCKKIKPYPRDVEELLTMSDYEVLQFISFKMFYAVICGAIIGFERRMNHAPAGFKTQILVCVGSMLFCVSPMIAGPVMHAETPRVIGQIVTGVGFLGAGSIIHNKAHSVQGLTTAAWIWFTAALGIMVGLGHGPVAVFITVTLTTVVAFFRQIEKKYFNDHKSETKTEEDSEIKIRKVG